LLGKSVEPENVAQKEMSDLGIEVWR